MLPTLVLYQEVAERVPEAESRLRLGVDETELRPVLLDLLGAEGHLLCFGDSGSGKTNLLRPVSYDLMSRFTDDQVVFAVLDIRRTLLDTIPEDYLGEYAGTPDDYDLLATGGPGPLAPFLELLLQSRDLGFHLVLTRRAGGAARAVHEPVPQRLKECRSRCRGWL